MHFINSEGKFRCLSDEIIKHGKVQVANVIFSCCVVLHHILQFVLYPITSCHLTFLLSYCILSWHIVYHLVIPASSSPHALQLQPSAWANMGSINKLHSLLLLNQRAANITENNRKKNKKNDPSVFLQTHLYMCHKSDHRPAMCKDTSTVTRLSQKMSKSWYSFNINLTLHVHVGTQGQSRCGACMCILLCGGG